MQQPPRTDAGQNPTVLHAEPVPASLDTGERVWEPEERARAEEQIRGALQAAELERNRLAKVLEVLPVGVAIADATGHVTLFNDALRRIWGSPPDAPDIASYGEWRARFADSGVPLKAEDFAMAQALLTGEPASQVIEIERFDGSGTATIINEAALIRDADGVVVGGVVTEVDITAQKLSEAALREAMQVAESANQAKTRFLAVVSHELRTPLTGVLGYVDLLENGLLGPNTPRQQDALARIKASSWHLVSIIDEILSISRVEAGKEELHLIDFDVAGIVREVAGMIEPQTSVRGVLLRQVDTNDPLIIRTDPGKLRQIVINLLGNAAKFTEHGSITISVDRTSADLVRIAITDTGPGIPESDRERIFQAFTQVDNTLTRSSGGTGLGLAISRNLARLLGGDVHLASVVGEGSTFTLELPRSAPVILAAAPPA